MKNAKHAADSTAALRKELANTCTLVDDPAQADFALLFVSPSSGEYFNATPGYLELDICEDKTVCNVDANGTQKPRCMGENDWLRLPHRYTQTAARSSPM